MPRLLSLKATARALGPELVRREAAGDGQANLGGPIRGQEILVQHVFWGRNGS